MQERTVGFLAACESAQWRPEPVREPKRLQYQVGVQTGHAPVAVQERVNPSQTVMSCGDANDCSLATAHTAVDRGPAFEKVGYGRGSGRDVFTDPDIS
jgi:hypothetical protein